MKSLQTSRKFSRSNQGECLILCLFTSTSCVEAIRVREMEKIYRERPEVRKVAQLTFRWQNISFRVDFIAFSSYLFSLRWKIWLSKIFWIGALVNLSFISG